MTVTINGTTGYTGPIGAIGDLSTTGNTTLGDAAGDTLTINGSTTTLTQGTANGVAYLNGSKNLTTGTALVFDGTNLGVGTTSPSDKLHISGSGSTALRVTGQSRFGLFAQDTVGLSIYQDGNAPIYFSTNATERVRIDSAGKVGINVSSNLSALLNFPSADSGEIINIFSSSSEASRSGIGKYPAEFRLYAATGDTYSWYTGGPSGTKHASLNASRLDLINLEGRLSTSGYGLSWLTVTGGAFTGTAASRIYDNGNLRLWTDDEMHFDVVGTTATAFWKFNSGMSSTGTGGTTLFTLSADGNMYFADSGNSTKKGIQGICATNDYWFIGGGGTGTANAGYMEIATGDDAQTGGASEPIYVSQYGPGSPLSGTLVRRGSLLDENGNTSFPNTLTVGSLNSGVSNFTGLVDLSASTKFSGTFYLTGSGAAPGNSTGMRMSENYGVVWTGNGSNTIWHHQVVNASYLCGFTASGGNYGSGNCFLSGTLTQNYSDIRFKTDLGTIENALDKVMTLRGFRYTINELGKSLGFNDDGVEAGLSAQDVQAVLPEAVALAGSDIAPGPNGENVSKSGENYLTLRYDRVVPLLVEAIKELKAELDAYKLTHH
jgi:hypothetical protein